MKRLEQLRSRIDAFVDQHNEILRREAELKQVNADLVQKLALREEQIAELEREIRSMRTAKQVTNGHGGEDLRARLDQHIKEIDRCLALLQ